jgi:hypothetical protein
VLYKTREKVKLQLQFLFKVAALALALGAFVTATALGECTTSSHFISDTEHTIVKGTGSSPHDLVIASETDTFHTCNHESYEGTFIGKTSQTFQLWAKTSGCSTAGEQPFTVDDEGCTYTLTSHGASQHGLLTVDCATGKEINVTHKGCEMSIPPQTQEGVTFTTSTRNGKHALTVDITIRGIETRYHGGVCVMYGTEHTHEIVGSLVFWGEGTAGEPVNLTHT